MTSPKPCTHTSVGILTVQYDRLLLIERKNPPYGWAPPAGHVDDGEDWVDAARRELWEETGLDAGGMRLLLDRRYNNRCRRPGGDHHHWKVFSTPTVGDGARSESETCAMQWVSKARLRELVALSNAHLAGFSSPAQWREQPGLEPVWMEILDAVAGRDWWS